jgi:hypothetical protein
LGRYLIIGGFEPSGHDSTAEAICDEGKSRGHAIDMLLWRDIEPLADHPMFTSHRYAAANGVCDIAGLLDEPWIGESLAADLSTRIPIGYDGYISVHPWSSLISAVALKESGDTSAILVDYHSDFGGFPVINHHRITAYLGGGRPRSLSPAIRSRSHYVGVTVPRRFYGDPTTVDAIQRPARLVVSAGADGWAVRAMLSAVHWLVENLRPVEVVLLAPNDDTISAWHDSKIANAVILSGVKDISSLLRTARWYLSKGGGTAVAEGLAAGCVGYVTRSGIFWEDEAAEHLSAHGIVTLVKADVLLGTHNEMEMSRTRAACCDAAGTLWSLTESGVPRQYDDAEVEILSKLAARLDNYRSDLLPVTTDKLAQNIALWRYGWSK